MIKKISIVFCLFLFSCKYVLATEGSVLIINQIRGSETCCQGGTPTLIKRILENPELTTLHLNWAVRSDALDRTYTDLLGKRPSDEVGLLLEVTPQLASASGVVYSGSPDGTDWYLASHALLVGYSQAQRKKIIDTAFTKFKSVFGTFPKFTVGWMIDGWSLTYIHETYGVVLHELTKEQYETDSYTLYGGIFNLPYYPSRTHPLIPGVGQNLLPVVMVRQTISDVLKNYGATRAVFTSQPNDYLSHPELVETGTYFDQLLDELMAQTEVSRFGVVGLENSQDLETFVEPFINQLQKLKSLPAPANIKIDTVSDFTHKFQTHYSSNPIYFLQSAKSDQEEVAWWYFGKTYRARLIYRAGRLILDDLRVFLPLTDPYFEIPASTDFAYWIVPYLWDGSQQFVAPDVLTPAQKKLVTITTGADTITKPFGLVVGQGAFQVSAVGEAMTFQFTGTTHTFTLLPDVMRVDGPFDPQFSEFTDLTFGKLFEKLQKTTITTPQHFDLAFLPDSKQFQVGWERDQHFVPLAKLSQHQTGFELRPLVSNQDTGVLNPLFQPDRSDLPVDSSKSIVYWDQTTTLVGKPLRLFIAPTNSLGRKTRATDFSLTFSQPENSLHLQYPKDFKNHLTPWFVDVTATSPTQLVAQVLLDNQPVGEKVAINFVPDCKAKIVQCLTKPGYLWKYTKLLLKQKWPMLGKVLD